MLEMNEAVLEALTRRLSDEDPGVRQAAAESLERLDTYRVLDDLLAALDSPDPTTVVRTLYALSELRHERALGGIVRALRHPAPTSGHGRPPPGRPARPRPSGRWWRCWMIDPERPDGGLLRWAPSRTGA
jgi:hypothetical protein